MDRAVIADLVERVRAAEGPDRTLDVRLLARIQQAGEWSEADVEYACADPRGTCDPPLYTASIDAALALVERVLPGWTVARIGQDDHKLWNAELREGHLTSYGRVALSSNVLRGTTAPLAILAALLTALSEGGSHAG